MVFRGTIGGSDLSHALGTRHVTLLHGGTRSVTASLGAIPAVGHVAPAPSAAVAGIKEEEAARITGAQPNPPERRGGEEVGRRGGQGPQRGVKRLLRSRPAEGESPVSIYERPPRSPLTEDGVEEREHVCRHRFLPRT